MFIQIINIFKAMTKRLQRFLYETNRSELMNIYRRAVKTAYSTKDDVQANDCLDIIDEIELNGLHLAN